MSNHKQINNKLLLSTDRTLLVMLKLPFAREPGALLESNRFNIKTMQFRLARQRDIHKNPKFIKLLRFTKFAKN